MVPAPVKCAADMVPVLVPVGGAASGIDGGDMTKPALAVQPPQVKPAVCPVATSPDRRYNPTASWPYVRGYQPH